MTKHTAPATWATLLENALLDPGRLASCYKAFHQYSIGNQLLAMYQCDARDLPIGPMATYKAWKAKGRQVQKGQKSLVLCVPVMVTRTDKETDEKYQVLVGFTYKAQWFTLAQTDGPDATLPTVPEWDWDKACKALKITRVPFEYPDGNSQGYSTGDGSVALNPVASHPARTMLHEMAHAILHPKGNTTDTATRELEAEAVAYLLSATFGLDGMEDSRGYMQSWYGKGKVVPNEVANRIFTTAQKILKAGTQEDK